MLRKSLLSNLAGAGFVFLLLASGGAVQAEGFSADDFSDGYGVADGYDTPAADDYDDDLADWDDAVPADIDAMPGLTPEQQKQLAEVERAYDKLLGKPPKLSPEAQSELERIWSKGEENLTAADEKRIAQLLGPIPKLTPAQQKKLQELDKRYDKIIGTANR